jgi:hypothetical protein
MDRALQAFGGLTANRKMLSCENDKIRVLVLWSHISGYMGACWRQLARQPDIELKVIAWSVCAEDHHVAFDRSVVKDVNLLLIDKAELNYKTLKSIADEFDAHVVIVAGWMSAAYRNLVRTNSANLPHVIMAMDTPWTGGGRQRLCRYYFHTFLSRIEHVVVAGERSWQYARQLGFDEKSISFGLYAWDENVF